MATKGARRLQDPGVMPDVEVKPSTYTIRMGIDPKAEKVKELIKANTLNQSKLSVGKYSR